MRPINPLKIDRPEPRPVMTFDVAFDTIRRELDAFLANLPTRQREALPPDVQAALDCIHAHLFRSDLSVGWVRLRCGLCCPSFSARFRFYCRATPRTYIETQRMGAAKRLLRIGDLQIAMIGMSVGYEEYRSFVRAFGRHAGCTPTAYRTRHVGRVEAERHGGLRRAA